MNFTDRESPKTKIERFGFNLMPAFRGTGARITFISKDYTNVRLKIPLNWRTRNYVGTIFGGSMFSAVDPVLMVMFYKILGRGQNVWVKSATIEFLSPGKGTLTGEFKLEAELIEDIQSKLTGSESFTKDFLIELKDSSGKVCAKILQTLYFRRKESR